MPPLKPFDQVKDQARAAVIAGFAGTWSNVATHLEAAGVGQIENLAVCTYGNPSQFYSYRRSTHRAEPDYGRHINAIALSA